MDLKKNNKQMESESKVVLRLLLIIYLNKQDGVNQVLLIRYVPPSSLKTSKKMSDKVGQKLRKQKIWADCLVSSQLQRVVFEKFFSYQKSGWGPLLYYVSKGTGWVGLEYWQFLLTFCTIYADVCRVSGSEKVPKCADVIQGWSLVNFRHVTLTHRFLSEIGASNQKCTHQKRSSQVPKCCVFYRLFWECRKTRNFI